MQGLMSLQVEMRRRVRWRRRQPGWQQGGFTGTDTAWTRTIKLKLIASGAAHQP